MSSKKKVDEFTSVFYDTKSRSTSPTESCELFKQIVQSVYDVDASPPTNINLSCKFAPINYLTFSLEDISSVLKNIDTSKSTSIIVAVL